MKHFLNATFLVLLGLFALAGCGGGGGGGDAPPSPPATNAACAWDSSTWDNCTFGS